MILLLVNIILAVTWAALTGGFDPVNLILGFFLGYLVLWITRRAFAESVYFIRLPQLAGFAAFILWELFVASLRVAYRIFSPLHRLKPRVVAVPLETCNALEMTILANLVSLTPGTLSLDVSADRCTLYVHAMYAPDPDVVRKEIKEGFERRVLALTRGLKPPEERRAE